MVEFRPAEHEESVSVIFIFESKFKLKTVDRIVGVICQGPEFIGSEQGTSFSDRPCRDGSLGPEVVWHENAELR